MIDTSEYYVRIILTRNRFIRVFSYELKYVSSKLDHCVGFVCEFTIVQVASYARSYIFRLSASRTLGQYFENVVKSLFTGHE